MGLSGNNSILGGTIKPPSAQPAFDATPGSIPPTPGAPAPQAAMAAPRSPLGVPNQAAFNTSLGGRLDELGQMHFTTQTRDKDGMITGTQRQSR